jgi:hypothetical protein
MEEKAFQVLPGTFRVIKYKFLAVMAFEIFVLPCETYILRAGAMFKNHILLHNI